MSMFDWIKFKTTCPKCGENVNGFQSKDKECLLDELEFWEVDNFYTSCFKCKTWIEYFIKSTAQTTARSRLTIDDYDLDFIEDISV